MGRRASRGGSTEVRTDVPPPLRADGTYSVTFVCTGNICRSPMGDVIVRSMVAERGLADAVVVSSSGTGGWHVGDGADPRTVAALDRHGYDGSPHRAARFDPGLFAQYDLVIAMDRSHVRDLRRLAPSPDAAERIVLLREFDPEAGDEVPDPYYGTEADFEDVLGMVERSGLRLVDAIRARLLG